MVFANFEELIEHVKRAPNCRTVAVAGSNDSHTLEAVLRGVDEGIVNLLLAGDKEETLAILKALGRTVPEDTIYHDIQKLFPFRCSFPKAVFHIAEALLTHFATDCAFSSILSYLGFVVRLNQWFPRLFN